MPKRLLKCQHAETEMGGKREASSTTVEPRVVTSRVTTDFQDTGTIWDQESLKQQEALYVLLSQIWKWMGQLCRIRSHRRGSSQLHKRFARQKLCQWEARFFEETLSEVGVTLLTSNWGI